MRYRPGPVLPDRFGDPRSDGHLCCQSSRFGELPDPPPDDDPSPVPKSQFSAVAAGIVHTCGLRTDGAVSCWEVGGLGIRIGLEGWLPSEGGYVALAVNHTQTCGIGADGVVVCWGDNRHGQTDSPEGRFGSIAVGVSHSCGIGVDGVVVCWGDNRHGQTDPPEGRFSSIAVGAFHSCGIGADGVVVCWGDNGYGQTTPPEGPIRHYRRQLAALVWDTHRRRRCVLGRQHLRADGPAGGSIHRSRNHRDSFVWDTHRPEWLCAGVTTSLGGRMSLRVDSPLSQPSTGIRVGYAQTAPLCAGVTTSTGRRIRRRAGSHLLQTGFAHSCGIRTDGVVVCWGGVATLATWANVDQSRACPERSGRHHREHLHSPRNPCNMSLYTDNSNTLLHAFAQGPVGSMSATIAC